RNYIQLYRAVPKTTGGNMKILHFRVFQQTARIETIFWERPDERAT
ncbi:hypothetical protein ABIA99_007739, partial [Bradyrhizobium sp. LB12.1]